MPTEFYMCPYQIRRTGLGPVRACAMDDLTPEIRAEGGQWSEAEIDGNRAIVRLRASAALLRSTGLLHRRLSETDARALHTPMRRTLRYDPASEQFLATTRAVPTTPLSTLVRRVPERPPSVEFRQILGLWLAVGFGEGWRLPVDTCWEMAKAGLPPLWGAAFPTVPLLDDFNRASLGANWTQSAFRVPDPLAIISSTLLGSSVNDYGFSYWNPTTFSGNLESTLEVPTVGTTNNDEVYLEFYTDPVTLWDGYTLIFQEHTAATDDWFLHRSDNGSSTQLGATTQTEVANGATLGLERLNGVLGAFHKPSAGAWSLVFDEVDATYQGPANLGVGIRRNTCRCDNFAGGNVGHPAMRRHQGIPHMSYMGRKGGW